MFNRIVSLAPSNTEILFALGAGDQVVGITTFCDYPAETKHLPRIGSWIHPHDMTTLKKLNPDLILTSMYLPPSIKTWAEQHNVELTHVNPQTLNGIYESITQIGAVVGKKHEAQQINQHVQQELARVQFNQRAQKPRAYTEEFHKPPTVAANWVPELVKIAGGIPMAKPGIYSYPITKEDVQQFNPDHIILHWCGFGLRTRTNDLHNREWHDVHAVKNNNLHVIDDTFLNRPGPRIWQGAKHIQRIIGENNV